MPPSGLIVSIDEVDPEDRRFALTPPWRLRDPRLERAIAAVGIQQPLLLQAVQGRRFRIVAGFKRHHAARGLGLKTLPAFLSANQSDIDLLLRALCDNLGARTLGPLETAEAVARLKAFGLAVDRLLDEVLPLLGLPSSRHHLERLLAVAALPEALKQAVTRRLTLDLALSLVSWRPDERDLFIGLVDDLQLGVNKQKQIFDLLDEVGRQGRGDVAEIWRSSGAAARAADRGTSPTQRFTQVKRALHKLRFPVLSEYEARYDALKRKLDLPPNIKLEVPLFFEGSRIQLTLTAGSVEELCGSLQRLGDAAETREMRGIFDLL